jgi:hypothetical protein
MEQVGDRRQVVGRGNSVVEVATQDFPRGWQEQLPAQNLADGSQAKGEGGDDADVAAAAADRPEEVRAHVGAGGHDVPLGRDDLRREEVVNGQPVLADHIADAAAGRQPSHADRMGVAGGEGETERVGRSGEIAGSRARLDTRNARFRIDADPLHL